MKKLIATLLAFAVMATSVCASQGPDQKHIDKIKKKVSSCLENSRRITIETYDDRKLQGSISEAGPDSFVLAFHNTSTTLNYAEVNRIKWPSSMSKTAKTVIAVAAVTGGLFLGVVLLGGLRG